MATYVIGDVQGCYNELLQLLSLIQFDKENDTLWFTGDLVNRGSHSLDVLRYVKALGEKHKTILGNHDLHLLAVAYGVRNKNIGDTLDSILFAPDRDELINWLCQREILHYDPRLQFTMVHAGLAPAWDLNIAQQLAHEVETALREAPVFFLEHMYGNQPDQWNSQLIGMERLRCIVNYFTRMRFCYADGRLDFSYKGQIADKPPELIPWFDVSNRANAKVKIIFGHWAALAGKTNVANVYAVDTGCVWGNCLTALRLEDEKRYTIKC